MKYFDFWGMCPHCDAELNYARFGADFRCWHCGRLVQTVHECYVDDPECCDYLMPVEDE